MGVCHDLSDIVFCLQDSPGNFIEAEPLRTSHLDVAIDGAPKAVRASAETTSSAATGCKEMGDTRLYLPACCRR
jgi:hypothetical protein